MVTRLWYIFIRNFGSLSSFLRCKEHLCPLSPDLGLWKTLGVPDWGLASWSWFGYGSWSLALYLDFEHAKNIYVLYVLIWGRFGYGHMVHPWLKFWLFILSLKVQRISMFSKSSIWAMEDIGGSWLRFGILIFIWINSMIIDKLMIQILALYLDFEGAKNILIL